MADGRSGKSRAQRRREARNAENPSPVRRWLKTVGVLLAAVVLVLIAADALGAFNNNAYTAVPHGSHSHYVPDECEDVRAGDFPTREPREGERITCDGQIVEE